MRTIRTAAAVAAVAALLGGSAACGGGDRERTPQEAFRASVKVMEAAGSANVVLQRQDPVDGASSGGGVLSWGSRPAMDVTMARGSGELKIRTLDGVVYLGANARQAALMGGRRWMRFDPAESSGDRGDAVSYSTWSEQLNPVSDLSALAEVGTVRRVGEERLDDVDTVHYQGAATATALVGASSALTPAQRDSVLGAYRTQGISSITADIWINGKDEVVQEKRTCRLTTGEVTTATRYAGIGTEVNIQAPLPADTFDLADLPGAATG